MTDAQWRALQAWLRDWTGMRVAEHRRDVIGASLAALAREHGLDSVDELLAAARAPAPAGDDVRDLLVARVTVGLTWFGRELGRLEVALARVEDRCRRAGLEDVYVWSAGCSSGEEPYTVAMALLERGLRPRVLATDISVEALRRAGGGRYRVAGLAAAPSSWRARYFDEGPAGTVEVREPVRRAVSFARHNLVTDATPPVGWGRFDLVLCRNVLIYFEHAEIVAITRRLATACRAGAELLVGAVEQSLLPAAAADVATALAATTRAAAHPAPPRLANVPAPAPTPAAPAPAPRPGAVVTTAAGAGLDPVEHLRRGLAAKRCGELALAIEHLRRARFLDGDRWLAPYALAVCLEGLGQAREAVEAYRHAAALMARGARPGLPEVDAEAATLAETVSGACHARLAALRARGAAVVAP